MEFLIFAARLLLAAIMGVAGFAKLADLAGSRQAMLGFGLPAQLAGALGLLLPIAEIVTALVLLITPIAWVGAYLALLLLLAFILGISVNLARGRTPQCHCFGQLHSESIGRQTLLRNALLTVVAIWLVWQGPQRMAESGLGALAGAQPLTWIALIVAVVALLIAALEGWFLINLLQQNGRLLLRIEALEVKNGVPVAAKPTGRSVEGLPLGSPAPAFALTGLHGETLTLDSLRAAQKQVLLVFIDPNCGPCNALVPDIVRWKQEYSAKLTVVPISRNKVEAARSAEHKLQSLLFQKDFEVANAYKVAGTPSAVLVDSNGLISSPVAGGAEAIQALVAAVVGLVQPALPASIPLVNGGIANTANDDDCACGNNNRNSNRNGVKLAAAGKPGDLAPSFQLPDLDNHALDLNTFVAAAQKPQTLLLFWNPSCGYCRQMLNDLKAWEAHHPAGAPNLLLISTGTEGSNRALGLQSPIVLDTDFGVALRYGVRGTPSAVLVDASGRIVSNVAEGRDAIFTLASGEALHVLNGAKS
jgi:peroxiredoxin/uncharacterized membrane protein YphA (DoxX/SURF4 family)